MNKKGVDWFFIVAAIFAIALVLVVLFYFVMPGAGLFGIVAGLFGGKEECEPLPVLSERIKTSLDELGQSTQIFETYEKLKKCYPDVEPPLLPEESVDLYLIVVEKKVERGDYAGAIPFLEKMISDQKYEDYLDKLNWLLGYSYYKTNKISEAKFRLSRVRPHANFYFDQAAPILSEISKLEVQQEAAALTKISSVTLIKTEPILAGGWDYVYEINFEGVAQNYYYGISDADKKTLLIGRMKAGTFEIPWTLAEAPSIIFQQINKSLGQFCGNNSCKKINVTNYGDILWPLPPKTELEQLRALEISTITKYESSDRVFDYTFYEIKYPENTYPLGKTYLYYLQHNKFDQYNLTKIMRFDYSTYQNYKNNGQTVSINMGTISENQTINEIKKDVTNYSERTDTNLANELKFIVTV